MPHTQAKTLSASSIAAILGMTLLLVCAPAQADDKHRHVPMSYDLDDYGVVPMAQLANHIDQQVGGTVIKMKLDAKKNPRKWKYKTKVLMPDGRLLKIEHNPYTLDVLKYKYKS